MRTSYAKATLAAMREEMERDAGVFLMGEDIAKQGGIFGQFKGLSEEFGAHRVRDFPISEAALISSAIGAALTGQRPVVDMHFSDFVTCAMDELTNQAAKLSYMFGGQANVPIVVRAPEGAVRSAAAQHSQSLEAWFVHTPGWRVVAPATPADARSLLKAAIRCDDPVLYLEHKALYSMKGEAVAADEHEDGVATLGRARVVRPGRDLTIVTWSKSLHTCLSAADELAGGDRPVEAEVLDLRTLAPWDRQCVLESVENTGRLLVVHEAVRTCGLGAEIVATVAEDCHGLLDAPPRRVANPDLPVPFAASLERAVIPQVADVVAAAREVAG
ncbi:alpha-ketoacid dehydrogenase subunit beta [Pseudonocardia sp. Ae717_Ps2]|uniref:alpha-ketoacid dehydrogenase subunit beta n=1 Tax=Pseudonocardia sp. Ae717_Ps2 TaxID=1885573 RepID=UPI00094AFBD0|nr:alpha-ketoacid dehydrogenase subunit beta [Pseudonocardia sp. Ae717_Ps2]